MVEQLSNALKDLSDMKLRHQFVSQKTQALHDACEQLVQEQVREIIPTLSFYNNINRISCYQ